MKIDATAGMPVADQSLQRLHAGPHRRCIRIQHLMRNPAQLLGHPQRLIGGHRNNAARRIVVRLVKREQVHLPASAKAASDTGFSVLPDWGKPLHHATACRASCSVHLGVDGRSMPSGQARSSGQLAENQRSARSSVE